MSEVFYADGDKEKRRGKRWELQFYIRHELYEGPPWAHFKYYRFRCSAKINGWLLPERQTRVIDLKETA